MQSYWFRNPVTGVLIRRGSFREKETRQEEGQLMMEAEIGVVETPKAGKR